MEDKIRITTETGSRLVGALIGLVRATDGMMHVTDDTNNIIIEGLHMSDIALGISDADMKAMIARNSTQTANAFAEDKKKTMEAGMNAHLSKPLNVPELMDTIRKFCDGKQMCQRPGKE